MRYRDTWDLTSIPDDPFYRELGRRRGSKGGRKVVPTADPDLAEKRRKQREYRQKRRADGLDR